MLLLALAWAHAWAQATQWDIALFNGCGVSNPSSSSLAIRNVKPGHRGIGSPSAFLGGLCRPVD